MLNRITCIRKILTFLRMATLVGLCILGSLLYALPTSAAIWQLQEAPGQVVYQSRQTFKDQQGDRWQAIAFKRVRADGSASCCLRLVGFPGAAEIDRSRPLILTSSLGQSFTLEDGSSQLSTGTSGPEPHVAQYNLEPAISQLQTAIPMRLTLPILNQDDALLSISPILLQEWKTIAAYE